MEISIIVPVYNTEKYLRCCIESILAQKFPDFELLLIDDGSTDGSAAICDSYAAKDNRVRVFHKANGGVSSARNMGLDNAEGKWVVFCDGDDSVAVGYLDSLLAIENEDMVMDSSGFDALPLENRVWCGKDIAEALIHDTCYKTTPWGKLFDLSLLRQRNIRFDERISSGEDSLFVFLYLAHIRTLRTTSARNYFYNKGLEVSLSKTRGTFEDAVCFVEELHKVTGHLAMAYSETVALTMARDPFWKFMSLLLGRLNEYPKDKQRERLKTVFKNDAIMAMLKSYVERGMAGVSHTLFYLSGHFRLYTVSEFLLKRF